jgi:hypothetical protein
MAYSNKALFILRFRQLVGWQLILKSEMFKLTKQGVLGGVKDSGTLTVLSKLMYLGGWFFHNNLGIKD